MAKHIAFMFQTGHSGGEWFQGLFNEDENVIAWGEINNRLTIEYNEYTGGPPTDYTVNVGGYGGAPTLSESAVHEIIRDFIKYQYERVLEHTMVIVKGFTIDMVDQCESYAGSVSKMTIVRHPLPAMHFYYRSSYGYDPDLSIFTGMVKKLKSLYEGFIRIKQVIPTYKLEEINEMVRARSPKFKKILDRFLNTDFDSDIIENVFNKQMNTNDESLYELENHLSIWNDFTPDQKCIYTENMSCILKALKYKSFN